MFTAQDYRAKADSLIESITVAGEGRIAAIPEGFIEASMQYSPVPDDWYDVRARGSVCYAVIEEMQPEELLNGRPQTTLRRSGRIPVHGWVIYFFADRNHCYCNKPDLPECYASAISNWLSTEIRGLQG